MNKTKLNFLTEKAVYASLKAGHEILKIYNDKTMDFQVEKKADNSPLTIADKTAHNTIINALKDSDLPILSEEGREIDFNERKNWEYFWLIDPLDGTKEFIKKNGEFTVNIALINGNTPVLGVIYAPVIDALYFTLDNSSYKYETGTYVDIENFNFKKIFSNSIKIESIPQNKKYTIIATRSHKTKELEDFVAQAKKKYGDLDLISAGSSLKFCKLAEGHAHIYPRLGPTMEWDTGAGHVICEKAGCLIKKYGSEDNLIYNKENLRNPNFIVKAKKL